MNGISKWISSVSSTPGFYQFNRQKVGATLFYDEKIALQAGANDCFNFEEPIESQHMLVLAYFELISSMESLKDMELYFRRFPFRKNEIRHSQHLRNCCEMYFHKTFQLRERLDKLIKAARKVSPAISKNLSPFLEVLIAEIDAERTVRNRITHDYEFDEVGISRLVLSELLGASELPIETSRYYYRKESATWAKRVKGKCLRLELIVEGVSGSLLSSCDFLNPAP